MYRILDLDNCISDDAHRIGAINWQLTGDRRYNDYHQLAGFDTLANADLLETNEELIIITGRAVSYHALTARWLANNNVRFRHLLMRNNGDVNHAAEMKRWQLRWLLNLYDVRLAEITSAFDDREDVIKMYRAEGIVNAQVRAVHNLDAYTNPNGGNRESKSV